jgi:DNA-binding YbaB/EbfC family protein
MANPVNPLGMPAGGAPDFGRLLQQAQMLQAQMESAQQALADAEVEGDAGGGLVKATVTGTGDILSVTIDSRAVDPSDLETLGDLVVAAVRAAQESAQLMQQDALGPLAGGGLPDISALGL